MPRYSFTPAEEDLFASSLLIELKAHPTDPKQRVATVQCGDALYPLTIDAVVLHDHASGYLYNCEIVEGPTLTADSAKAADIALGYITAEEEDDVPAPPSPPTPPVTITTPPAPPRQKISQVAASPEPPSAFLEELP